MNKKLFIEVSSFVEHWQSFVGVSMSVAEQINLFHFYSSLLVLWLAVVVGQSGCNEERVGAAISQYTPHKHRWFPTEKKNLILILNKTEKSGTFKTLEKVS